MDRKDVIWMGLLQRLRRKKEAFPYCAAVVPAAGSSTRMGQDKLFLPLNGVPVLLHTLRALDACPRIHEIVVVTREEHLVPISQLCKDGAVEKVRKVVVGGATRSESVLAGLREVDTRAALIAIHDGARPLVSQRVLEEVLAAAAVCSAAAPSTPVKDTIKAAHNGVIESTPDRSTLFAVQTPQVFDADLIRTALTRAVEEGVELTDDCGAVERLGIPVRLTAGEYINLKITTPEDAAVAEALLDWRDSR